ncbi:hypothetical protein ACOSP7_010427 [Xanthoceras sorbifolium]
MEKYLLRKTLLKGIRWRIGNGQRVGVYEDNWLHREGALNVLSPRVLSDGVIVFSLIDKPRVWSEELVMRHFNADEADIILGISLSSFPREEPLLWHLTKGGSFFVKSAYTVALRQMSDDIASCSKGPTLLWKKIWNLKIPSKIKIFYWKACKESLPTLAFLFKRSLVCFPIFPLCLVDLESVEHMVWGCNRLSS